MFSAECPICKEGKSAGRSRRLFYFPHKGYFYCHNCVRSWRPLEWIKEVTSWTFTEIVKKNQDKKITNEGSTTFQNKPFITEPARDDIVLPDLPENSIDLTDKAQLEYYKHNKFVKLAVQYCESRRLLAAKNKCHKFFVSLDDIVHKNRLVIPFYDEKHKVVCYQTRALTQNQFPKYLTKFGEKGLFGVSSIQSDIPYVFIFEGPIDSMFVVNGLAIASLSPTEKQTQELNNLIGYQQIWVFDNDKNNKQTKRKIEDHIKKNKTVFVWPKEFRSFKDFNEICCCLSLDEIPWKFVVKNSFAGQEALIKQTVLNSSSS